MKRPTRHRYWPPRSGLRLADLKQRIPAAATLMNVKIPATLADAIDRLARELNATKTEVVIALLNAGLEVASQRLGGRQARR